MDRFHNTDPAKNPSMVIIAEDMKNKDVFREMLEVCPDRYKPQYHNVHFKDENTLEIIGKGELHESLHPDILRTVVSGSELGIFAKEDLPPNTTIYRSRPVLRIYTEKCSLSREPDAQDVLCEVCEAVRVCFPDLFTSFLYDSALLTPRMANKEMLQQVVTGINTENLDTVTALNMMLFFRRVLANAFIHNDDRTMDVYLSGSLFNHGCVPNCTYEFDGPQHEIVVTTVQPIQKGEQCTINYLQNHAIFKRGKTARIKFLQSRFGFTCKCAKCKTPDN